MTHSINQSFVGIRSVTPSFGQSECTVPRGTTLSKCMGEHPYKRRLQEVLRGLSVSQKVREVVTTYSAEKHVFTLIVLRSAEPLSITPTREIVVGTDIVQKYRGPFPRPYRLGPFPSLLVAYRVSGQAEHCLFVAGREIKYLKIDTSFSKPRINDPTQGLK